MEKNSRSKGGCSAGGLPVTGKLDADRFFLFFFFLYPMHVASPQSSILSCSSSRYDFGDEDAGVVAHVRVVGSTCYAEAEA